jgi:rhodanese-related sulfurtransferase
MSKSSKKREARAQARAQSQARRNIVLVVGGIVVVAALVVLVVLLTTNRGSSAPAEISVAEAATKRDQGAFILDVRTPEEWEQFHIPNSTLIPLDELEARVAEVPSDQEVVVVCRSGNRSQQGRDILKSAGFTQVSSMAGGVTEWQSQGYPTETGP